MNKKQKKILGRLAIAILVFVVSLFCPDGSYLKIGLSLVAYVIAGYDVVIQAIKNIGHGQFLDENFLMTLATFGAIYIGQISEGVSVMVLYQIGELFQSYAVNKSRGSINDLMEMMPEYANVLRDGQLETVDPDEVEVGEIVIVKPGEKVPLDGILKTGEGYVDTVALTGESVPRWVSEGDEVLSGCINQKEVLEIEVTKEYDESTVAKILELVENAGYRKAHAEDFISKFAKYYTPIVVAGALLLAFVPTLAGSVIPLSEWIRRACMFLVISCPCALVISVPLSFFGGIGASASEGILVKGSNYIEVLAKADTVVFDKTGTLTEGTFEVIKVQPAGVEGFDKEKILEIAAVCESYSNHPVAESIRNAYGLHQMERAKNVEEIGGKGIRCQVDGVTYRVGNRKFQEEIGVEFDPAVGEIGTVVYLADDRYLGYIVVADRIKDETKDAIFQLKKSHVSKTIMLTGDRKETGEKTADIVGIDQVYTELLPADKVSILEKILDEKKENTTVAYVGDGINDAPVLTRADVGIAMGSLGSDAAVEAADVVILDDDLSKISTGIRIAKKTISIVKQNISFALGIKILFLALSVFGIANLWEAVFADVGVAVIAILNAMRTLKNK